VLDDREATAAASLLNALCAASGRPSEECLLESGELEYLLSLGAERAGRRAEEIRAGVAGRFRPVGACLVEEGVEIDEGACRDMAWAGVLVVAGRAGQVVFDDKAAPRVVRVGGFCAALVGDAHRRDARGSVGSLLERGSQGGNAEVMLGRPSLVRRTAYWALVALGECSLEGAAAIARRAARVDLDSVEYLCWSRARHAAREAAVEEELEACLRILRGLEGGGR